MKINPLPPLSELNRLLLYEQDTGILIWKIRCGRAIPGTVAGSIKTNGYMTLCVNKTQYYAHRIIWKMMTKQDPENLQIDHVNGNPADNRLQNLRLATCVENHRNVPLMRSNSSGVKGVHWFRRDALWVAQIRFNGRTKHIGRFHCIDEARSAVESAREKVHAQFAHHG